MQDLPEIKQVKGEMAKNLNTEGTEFFCLTRLKILRFTEWNLIAFDSGRASFLTQRTESFAQRSPRNHS